MRLYKEFLVVENSVDVNEELDVSQIFDFIKATDIKNATKIANSRGYNIPQNARVIANNLNNINTVKLSVISKIINNMIDKGVDDKHFSEHKNELKQIKKLFNQVL